jgi:hypothetical protein
VDLEWLDHDRLDRLFEMLKKNSRNLILLSFLLAGESGTRGSSSLPRGVRRSEYEDRCVRVEPARVYWKSDFNAGAQAHI